MAGNSNKGNVNRKKEFPVFTVSIIVIIVLVAALVTYNILSNNGTFIKNKTVLKYEDTEITGMDFYYPYTNLLDSYSSILPYIGISSYEDLLEPSSFDSSMTWQEYFASLAYTDIATIVQLCSEAKKEGVVLEDEDLQDIEDTINEMKDAAEESDMSFKEYLYRKYRKGFTEENLEKMLRLYTLGNKQQNTKRDSFTYTEDEIEAYYNENKTSFDKYTYRLMTFEVSDDSDAADTKKAAEEFLAKITDEASFIAAANEALKAEEQTAETAEADDADQAEEKDETLFSEDAYSAMETAIQEWMSDDERKEGDKTLITDEDTGTCYVVYFISAAKPDYDAVSIRLIKYDASYDDDATDEEIEEAIEKARKDLAEMIEEWAEDGKSEDDFATMALLNSSDSSMSNGGLSENFSNTYYDAYGKEISAWIFDEARQEGDYTVIDTEDGACALYFVSNNGSYFTITVENSMKDEDLMDYLEDLEEAYSDKIEMHREEAIKAITG